MHPDKRGRARAVESPGGFARRQSVLDRLGLLPACESRGAFPALEQKSIREGHEGRVLSEHREAFPFCLGLYFRAFGPFAGKYGRRGPCPERLCARRGRSCVFACPLRRAEKGEI